MSTATYDVIEDFRGKQGDDYVTTTPYWILCVLRLKFPTTFERAKSGSRSKNYSETVELRGKPLILTDEVVQLQVQSSKGSYIGSLSATLKETDVALMNEIMPGDYLFAWIVNNKADYASLLDRLNQSEAQACNRFMDGLKFVGKTQSIHKQLQQSPGGERVITYSLQGSAFTEFDAQLFYDPYLAERPDIGNDISTYFAKIGAALNELVRPEKGQAAGIDVNRALPFFIDLLLGRGIPPNLSVNISDERLRSTTGLDAEASYVVPKLYGELLGKTRSSESLLRYADVLETVIGLQRYQRASNVALAFQPVGTLVDGSRRFTDKQMLGTFLPQTPQFTNRPVWSVLEQFLNKASNEMYTCLRVNPDGNVVPTFVARQLPFSTSLFKSSPVGATLEHTPFMELPRWRVDPLLVRSVDIGRSDSLRFNFVHVYGAAIDPLGSITEQIIRNPPVRDDLDVARSGLRLYMQTIPCLAEDVRNGSPTKWMALLSDFLIGQHLTMTGVMQTVGIQSPICVGDNLEWDDIVFHIESVSHVCSINPNGQKTWSTNLSLSHGVRADPGSGASDTSIYAGILPSDQISFDPGSTVDSVQPQRDEEESSQSALLGNLGDFVNPDNGGLT